MTEELHALMCGRQVEEMHEQAVRHAAEVRKLYPKRAVTMSHKSMTHRFLSGRQIDEMHEQAAGHAAEVRKLYDWRDVMKTVHQEKLQELASKHQTDRDALLADISQR